MLVNSLDNMDGNNSTNATAGDDAGLQPAPDAAFKVFQIYIPIMIGTTGILGNGLVCFVFLYKRKVFKSLTNSLILNQSVLDLASSVIFLLQRFAPRPGPSASTIWIDLVCRVWGTEFFLWSLNNASTGNLVLISLERYAAVCYPVTHRNVFTKKRAAIICMAIYILGFLLVLYAPFFSNKKYGCYVVWEDPTAQMIFGVFHLSVTYIIPLSIMIFSYANIWMGLKRRGKSNRDTEQESGGQFGRAKKNVIITLCIVAIAFVVCWTPASITYSLYNFGYPYDLTSDTHSIFLTLVLCNLSVNPIVYGFKYREFRRQIKQIFCPSAKVGNEPSNSTESTA